MQWMEAMKGARWQKTLLKENTHFETAIQSLAAPHVLQEIVREFAHSEKEHGVPAFFTVGKVDLSLGGTYTVNWKWHDETTFHDAAVVFSEGDFAWVVERDPLGRETYSVACYEKGRKTPIWRGTKSIGPFLCVKDGCCYTVEATRELRYGILSSLDAYTGKDRKILFTEPNGANTLSLVAGENQCIFLVSENSGKQKLYHVTATQVHHLCPEGLFFVPVGFDGVEPCYFARLGSLDVPYSTFGSGLRALRIPVSLRRFRIEAVSMRDRLIFTTSGGLIEIYKSHKTHFEKLISTLGTVTLSQWAAWWNEPSCFIIDTPGSYPNLYTLEKSVESTPYAFARRHFARSRDGTLVPYILVGTGKKGLLVSVYGAYGIPTNTSTGRWKPYLDAGWTIAFALVRGGGDMGEAWAEAARRNKKWKTIEDTEAICRTAQRETGIPWNHTCLFGRSAGGYCVGAIVSRHGRGGLLGAAYTEVPYVDVLRTTSNPKLPLTVLEYDEFGNPRERQQDMETLLHLSPVTSLPPEGAPNIFVVVRTATNDREVLAYESVKWITRLRGYGEQPQEKYLFIAEKEGHFSFGSKADRRHAEDFLLLNSWLASLKSQV